MSAEDRRALLQGRAARLRALLERVTAELAAVEEELDPAAARAERIRLEVNARQRAYRARKREEVAAVEVARSEWCGTERGYHWHRLHGPWPLPADDPCRCRGAHAEHVRTRKRSA